MVAYIGIDVGKEQLQVCILEAGGEQQLEYSNALKGWKSLSQRLKGFASVRVALEATGSYGAGVSEYLHHGGYWVSVVNPAQIKAYAQSQLKRHKTDRIDAAVLADFCRTQEPGAWTPPSAAERELRGLVRRLDDLKVLRQGERNRLESHPTGAVKRQIEQLIKVLDQQIVEIERAIQQQVKHNPELQAQHELLTSIPGVGVNTSAHLLAELGNLARFNNVREVVAMAGLNPQQRQSGRSLHYTAGISRMGRRELRAALYMPALTAMRHNPLLKVFAERKAAQGLPKKAIVVAVMRKLLHLAYGVVKHGQPFDPAWQPAPLALVAT